MSDIRHFLNTPQKLKEGHKEQFKKDVLRWAKTAQGVLGWSGQANMMVDLGMDRYLFPGRLKSKKKRIRRKVMKRILKDIAIRDVFRHIEGFDDEGYRICTS